MNMTSLEWFKKMYVWFKRLPLIAFWFGPIEGLIWGIVDYTDFYFLDPEWLSFIIWPIAGVVLGVVNCIITSIIISPIVLRTSVAIGEQDN